MPSRILWKPFIAIFVSVEFSYILSQFLRSSVGPISDVLIKEIPMSQAEIGFLSGVFFLTFALSQIPGGLCMDRFGPAKTLFYLQLISALGSILFAIAGNYSILLLSRALQGIGCSVVIMIAFKFFHYMVPDSKFSPIAGTSISVGSIGAIMATAPLVFSVEAIGYKSVFFIISGISVFAGSILLIVSEMRFVQDAIAAGGNIDIDANVDTDIVDDTEIKANIDSENTNNPDIGDNIPISKIIAKKNTLDSVISDSSIVQKSRISSSSMLKSDDTLVQAIYGVGKAFQTESFIHIASMKFTTYACIITILGLQGIPYLTSVYDISDEQASFYLLLMAVGMIMGLLIVPLADSFFNSRKIPVLIGSSILSISYLLMAFIINLNFTIFILVFISFISGYMAISQAHAKAIFPEKILGRGLCSVNMMVMIGVSYMQTISGVILGAFEVNGQVPTAAFQTLFGVLCFHQSIATLIYSRSKDIRPFPQCD